MKIIVINCCMIEDVMSNIICSSSIVLYGAESITKLLQEVGLYKLLSALHKTQDSAMCVYGGGRGSH